MLIPYTLHLTPYTSHLTPPSRLYDSILASGIFKNFSARPLCTPPSRRIPGGIAQVNLQMRPGIQTPGIARRPSWR